MPYIERGRRKANNPLVIAVPTPDLTQPECRGELIRPIAIDDVGELNFAITTLISEYVRRRTLSYAVLNDVVGVMASALAEFQRRIVAPYEDKKRAENGEVYDCLDPLLMHILMETDHAKPDKQA